MGTGIPQTGKRDRQIGLAAVAARFDHAAFVVMTGVCTENLNSGVVVMEPAKNDA